MASVVAELVMDVCNGVSGSSDGSCQILGQKGWGEVRGPDALKVGVRQHRERVVAGRIGGCGAGHQVRFVEDLPGHLVCVLRLALGVPMRKHGLLRFRGVCHTNAKFQASSS